LNTETGLTDVTYQEDHMANRIISFPARSTNPQSNRTNARLLKAAKAAYNALLLAVASGEENTIIKTLGAAIRAAESGPQPPKTPAPVKQIPRCEVSYSFDADLTGERAVMCGRRADVECEHCGPICYSCLAEVTCFGPQHVILADSAVAA
jgi:hypothetical protein